MRLRAMRSPPGCTSCWKAADSDAFRTLRPSAVRTEQGKVLMTTWHSQYNAGVDEAKRRLSGKRVSKLFVNWREDVRKWHPGQTWIFEAGGFGIFDPGINALSIVTKIMPEPVFVKGADLFFPSNADAPIAANVTFSVAGRDGPSPPNWTGGRSSGTSGK
jgi:D-galactose 1-dehydrogenase